MCVCVCGERVREREREKLLQVFYTLWQQGYVGRESKRESKNYMYMGTASSLLHSLATRIRCVCKWREGERARARARLCIKWRWMLCAPTMLSSATSIRLHIYTCMYVCMYMYTYIINMLHILLICYIYIY